MMTTTPARQTTERRTQAERSEAMRQKLIEATLDCLISEGYAELTIGKITERAGVSRGAPLHHFSTKGALVEAAAREVVKRLSRQTAHAYAVSKDTPDPLQAFGMAVWRDIFAAQEGVLLSELTYASRHEPEIEAIVKKLWTQMYRVTTRIAVRYVRTTHPDIPAERVVFLTQWLMRGMSQDVHLGAPPELFESYLKLWRQVLGSVTESGVPQKEKR